MVEVDVNFLEKSGKVVEVAAEGEEGKPELGEEPEEASMLYVSSEDMEAEVSIL
jgi:hypothetical protein